MTPFTDDKSIVKLSIYDFEKGLVCFNGTAFFCKT